MLKRFICNPIFLFISVWLSLILVVKLNTAIEFIILNELTITLYYALISFSVAWLLGGFLAYPAFAVQKKVSNNFKNYSINGRKSINLIILFLYLYFIFKILDIFQTTGTASIAPDNIEAYRYAITEMGLMPNFRFINILNPILLSLPAIIFHLYINKIKCKTQIKISLIVSYILFVYLSSSRSSAFVSLLILFFILVYNNVKFRIIFIFPFILFVLFGFIGSLVGKSGYEPFFIYLLAPIHAFDVILNNNIYFDYQLLSFRPFHGLLQSLGILDSTFHLIDYIETPIPVNVFTVFSVYYYDFGLAGTILFLMLFSFLSTSLHLHSIKTSSFRLQLLSSFYLSFIVLGVFYDYYTSSMFSFLAPILIYLLIPVNYNRN